MQSVTTEVLGKRAAASGLFLSRPTATTATTATGAALATTNYPLVPSRSLEAALFAQEQPHTLDALLNTPTITFPANSPRGAIGSGGPALRRQRSVSLDEGLASFMGSAMRTGKMWSRSLADGSSSSQADSSIGAQDLPHVMLDDEGGLRNAVVGSEEDEIRACMMRGELVPDKTMVRLLDRKMTDICQKPSPVEMPSGWMLDGFPRNANQVHALAEMRRLPDIVLNIDAAEEEILTRILDRRTDPVTGETYNLKTNPPPPQVAARLEKRSDDNLETIAQRLRTWKNNWPGIEAAFKRHGIAVVTVHALPSESIDQVYQKVRGVMFNAARPDNLIAGSRPLNVVFTGAPGSGKGTQCELASADFGFAHLSTGQLLRDIVVDSPRSFKPVHKPPRLPTNKFTALELSKVGNMPLARFQKH